MHRSWSLTLKLLAVALLLLTRHVAGLTLPLAALGAVLAAVVLDWLDWRRGRTFPGSRLLSGAALLVAVAFFLVRAWQGPPIPTVEVPEFGFRLRQPGPDWQLLAKPELPSPPYAPNVQAGATSYDGVLGVVQVLPLRETSPNLDALATQHKATIDWPDRRELGYETVTFAGHEARRYVITGTDPAGTKRKAQTTLFVRGQFEYIIEVVGPLERQSGDEYFQTFANAVELISFGERGA